MHRLSLSRGTRRQREKRTVLEGVETGMHAHTPPRRQTAKFLSFRGQKFITSMITPKRFPRWAAVRWTLVLNCRVIQQIQSAWVWDETHFCQTSQSHDAERLRACSLLQHETKKPEGKRESEKYPKEICIIR